MYKTKMREDNPTHQTKRDIESLETERRVMQYTVGKVYFSPDEVEIVTDREAYPLESLPLSELFVQDPTILNEEQKEKAKSLILHNCRKSEEELITLMAEKQLSDTSIKITNAQRIGRERADNKQNHCC